MKVEKRKSVLRAPDTTFCRRASPLSNPMHSLIGCAVVVCGWHGHLSADSQNLGSETSGSRCRRCNAYLLLSLAPRPSSTHVRMDVPLQRDEDSVLDQQKTLQSLNTVAVVSHGVPTGSVGGKRWGVQIMELARAGKVGLICSGPCLYTRGHRT